MAVVRRWYLYVSATIGLQGFTWALIGLLNNAFVTPHQTIIGATAFNLAIFATCLPLWVIHWLWGERLARRDRDERVSAVRQLYLYGNLAAFLMPLVSNVYTLLETTASLLIGANLIDPQSSLGSSLIASLILGALFAYHNVVAGNDARQTSLTAAGALIRRVYLLAFAAFGVLIWANAAIDLLRLIFGFATGRAGFRLLSNILIKLLIGMALWLGHWWRAQRLFASADEDERGSAFRKFYLYAMIVGASLTAVTIVTGFLASIFRSWLGLPVSGDLIDVIAPVAVWTIVAFYHVSVINADAAAIVEGPRQAGIRRLAWYLVAAIGQLTALIGAGGLLSVIIRGLAGEGLITDLRDPLAWFSAVLVAGLPIWFWCWRHVQRAAAITGAAGIAERNSLVRRIYLFGFLFVASLTLLSALIYMLFRLISIALGEPFSGNLLADLAQAIAYSLIAVGVLVTHGLAVRTDSRVREAADLSRQAQVRVAVLAEGELAERIAGALRERFPQLALAVADGAVAAETQLANADLIVGVWQPSSDPSQLERYPAQKLLIPLANPNWAWVGMEPAVATNIPAQLVQAVRQTLAGEPLRPQRGVGAGAVVGALIAIVVVILVIIGGIQVALFAFR